MGALRDAARAIIARKVLVGALTLSAAGGAGITMHEGSVPEVYLDPVNIPTVCVGHTRTVSKDMVGTRFSPEQCDQLLREDTQVAERAVKRHVKVPVTQEQYDSLVSLTFNVGASNFAGSTLLKRLNAGDCWGAAKEFNRWIYARGKKLPGLINRRADESRSFATGCVP